ncbi:uncharacterized protein PHALS_03436 [Plasmopara halstedii]|uniref:Uncharacterized protein n=1 Tax=Plasmopara halstedii TaxID=4781 RepID=A0A0P1B0H1_PLAHL|nr:uncharacterized protein PHALS_03436 [Plasmopara halstedii]CEG46753.1 hypothetical protein PHALS_03436 [Plasmopara halstedii]|eukprot:XP_024583122.1 hypothetical protein PHALS_03436 [Plasmopara halstedii]
MQNVLIDRPGTQHLAFRMEMNGIKDCNSIVEENASHFLLLNFFEQKYEQIKTLERFLQAYKAYEVEPKAPLTPNDQNQGVVFRLNREESDQEILTRESQSNYLIYKFAKDMLKYVRELKDPGLY